MKSLGSFLATSTLLSFLAVPATFGTTIGQIDTFEDGTTAGWVVGLLGALHLAPPENVPRGGPGGVDDNFLLLRSAGSGGAGSHLTVLNPDQWAGNYLAAGIGTIRMDVANFGDTDLALRLLFEDPQGGPRQDHAFSKVPILLPAASGWATVSFPIDPAALQADAGSVDAALMNATVLRIFHSTYSTYPGESITASLGVDNIQAIRAVPETTPTLGLLALSLLAFRSRRAGVGPVS